MDQIKIFEAVPTGVLEQFVNDWIKENYDHIVIVNIQFVCGEYGRHFVMVQYAEITRDSDDKFSKGE